MNAGDKILEHTPEDMTVTVEAGMTLANLQIELARHRQWLPLDPPHPDSLTIAGLINQNPSGPRRFGYGTVRDYLIGIKVLADGTVIHSGGKVVKNVAGYDLMKLFIGARDSLGIVLETTFKLRPLPEAERLIRALCSSLEQADKLVEEVMQSDVAPVVLDLASAGANSFAVVLGFAGTKEEVEWQLARTEQLGLKQPASLDYETQFWNNPVPAHRLSVLPSKLVETLRTLNAPFVARAGNGVIYHRGQPMPRKEELPLELMRRVKAAFDPNHVLPELQL